MFVDSWLKPKRKRQWLLALIVMAFLIGKTGGFTTKSSRQKILRDRCHHCYGPYKAERRLIRPQTACQFSQSNGENESSNLKEEDYSLLTAVVVVGAALFLHSEAWTHLSSSLVEMKTNASLQDFQSGFVFWLFGAILHPLLQPIFWISEVLHASPGPKLFGLLPVSFLLGSAGAVYALITVNRLRNSLLTAAVAALVYYVGAGLQGSDPNLLGDYNIQLDDSYQAKAFKKGVPLHKTSN